MFFFLILAFICLSGTYLCHSLRRAFGRRFWPVPFALFFACIIAVWYVRHNVPQGVLASLVMQAGFAGLGFLLIAAVLCLIADLFGFILRRIPTAARVYRAAFAPRRAVPAALILAVLVSAYAVYEARDLRGVQLSIPTAKLPAGTQRFRLAVVSDVHLSRYIGADLLREIADKVNAADADLFLSLGDLVDTDMSGRDEDTAILRSIKTRYGSFGVLGNHEEYRGQENSLSFHEKAGITLLRAEALAVGPLLLAGVDDTRIDGADKAAESLARQLRQTERGRFVLFLCHRPKAPDGMYGLFDLMLSGHTHGGQIKPVGVFFEYLMHRAPAGLGLYAGGLRYVTNGAGFWGPPMRLLAPPEVLIIDLVPEPGR